MMSRYELIAFILCTLFIIWFSWWLSIKDKRYHGIARFFAFEGALLLLLLNYRAWFIDPFCLRQLFSWFFLCFSLYPVFYAYYLIKTAGKPHGKFENTSRLVARGIYKYIRHPMYLSIAVLSLGIFLKRPDVPQSVILAVIYIAVFFTAKIEEGELIKKFGDEYMEYMKKTKMFVPYIF